MLASKHLNERRISKMSLKKGGKGSDNQGGGKSGDSKGGGKYGGGSNPPKK